MRLPRPSDYYNNLKNKYKGCLYQNYSEILNIEKLPNNMQVDIVELSKRYGITLRQANDCYMASGLSEQTNRFCETIRDKGEYLFEAALYEYFSEKIKKSLQELRFSCNNYRKMHGLPLIRRK